ncbi:hypothetical protein AAFF_G00165750 [Aldrovandia affinis]|uniref:Uncharacterized protein n=1 Tax=Aldrovandia affinis TaxID=143900 RepID=A0AAD7RMF9_9TELE|nr:hypothetical protein AAFF_G00165750 [Aldrovandia affinis]
MRKEKLDRITGLLFVSKSRCTKRDLLSLSGHLNYAMRVLAHSRSFTSYLLSLAASVSALHDSVQLDLFLPGGTSPLAPPTLERRIFYFFRDNCTSSPVDPAAVHGSRALRGFSAHACLHTSPGHCDPISDSLMRSLVTKLKTPAPDAAETEVHQPPLLHNTLA